LEFITPQTRGSSTEIEADAARDGSAADGAPFHGWVLAAHLAAANVGARRKSHARRPVEADDAPPARVPSTTTAAATAGGLQVVAVAGVVALVSEPTASSRRQPRVVRSLLGEEAAPARVELPFGGGEGGPQLLSDGLGVSPAPHLKPQRQGEHRWRRRRRRRWLRCQMRRGRLRRRPVGVRWRQLLLLRRRTGMWMRMRTRRR